MFETQIFDASGVSANRLEVSKSAVPNTTPVMIGQNSVTSSSAQLERLLCRAMTLCKGNRNALQGCLNEALTLVTGHLHEPVTHIPSTRGALRGALAPWQVKLVLEYIDANLGSTLRLDAIAKLVGFRSTSHFSRAFKVSRGFSPGAYISMTRVNRAKLMIDTTREPICRIAVDCGFSDQAHLCKSFRRWAGVSPATWRREQRTTHPQSLGHSQPCGPALTDPF
jgi:AraC-like DNA-binding protein